MTIEFDLMKEGVHLGWFYSERLSDAPAHEWREPEGFAQWPQGKRVGWSLGVSMGLGKITQKDKDWGKAIKILSDKLPYPLEFDLWFDSYALFARRAGDAELKTEDKKEILRQVSAESSLSYDSQKSLISALTKIRGEKSQLEFFTGLMRFVEQMVMNSYGSTVNHKDMISAASLVEQELAKEGGDLSFLCSHFQNDSTRLIRALNEITKNWLRGDDLNWDGIENILMSDEWSKIFKHDLETGGSLFRDRNSSSDAENDQTLRAIYLMSQRGFLFETKKYESPEDVRKSLDLISKIDFPKTSTIQTIVAETVAELEGVLLNKEMKNRIQECSSKAANALRPDDVNWEEVCTLMSSNDFKPADSWPEDVLGKNNKDAALISRMRVGSLLFNPHLNGKMFFGEHPEWIKYCLTLLETVPQTGKAGVRREIAEKVLKGLDIEQSSFLAKKRRI